MFRTAQPSPSKASNSMSTRLSYEGREADHHNIDTTSGYEGGNRKTQKVRHDATKYRYFDTRGRSNQSFKIPKNQKFTINGEETDAFDRRRHGGFGPEGR